MRSCCSVTAAWPDCCLENCCTRASPLASSSSSPPTSALQDMIRHKTTRHNTMQQVNQVNRPVTSPLVIAEGVTSSEGGGSDVLHFPALQPQTGAASGDDEATDPRSEYCGPSVSAALSVMLNRSTGVPCDHHKQLPV